MDKNLTPAFDSFIAASLETHARKMPWLVKVTHLNSKFFAGQ